MSSVSQFFGGGRIKSIQRGVATGGSGNTSFSLPITAVDTTKSILYHLGTPSASAGSFTETNVTSMITLESSTTININFGQLGGGFFDNPRGTVAVSWQLVEYY
jgi:hypothetical protein